MMMMLVSETQDKSEDIIKFFRDEAMDIIHYSSPMKALDNLQEIAPDAVLLDAVDFPRHWKVITQYLRYNTSKNEVVVILIVNNLFSALDMDKAIKVGVQGIINVESSLEAVVKQAQDILVKYKSLIFKKYRSSRISYKDLCSFLFVDPITASIITGKISQITSSSMLFIPDTKVEGLEKDMILANCSLKIEDYIITPKARVIEIANYITLEFLDMNESDVSAIENFLKKMEETRR